MRTHPHIPILVGPERRIGWQLAALTGVLLFVLLLGLNGIIYASTRYILLQSLRSTLIDHARPLGAVSLIQKSKGILRLPERDALPARDQRPLDSSPLPFRASSTVRAGNPFFTLAVDTHLHTMLGLGPLGTRLPDPIAAEEAIHSLTVVWATHVISSEEGKVPYLMYSLPFAQANGPVIGVIQAGISEQQVLQSLGALLWVLLLTSGVGVLASAAITGVLVRRALQPIRSALQHQREFIADAAHELRTPLAIVRASAETGLMGGPEDHLASLESVLSQSTHLARLVDSLLLLANTDSGAALLASGPVNVADVVRETVDGVSILAEERGVTLRVSTEVAWVLGDIDRLRQLILILLDNALKHVPDAGIITTRVERHGNWVQLQVQDSGAGIDPADLPRIFERFYRADRSRTSSGVGLGLAIGRWIAQAHGGSITADNVTNPTGALFSVLLPVVTATSGPPRESAMHPKGTYSKEHGFSVLRHQRRRAARDLSD